MFWLAKQKLLLMVGIRVEASSNASCFHHFIPR